MHRKVRHLMIGLMAPMALTSGCIRGPWADESIKVSGPPVMYEGEKPHKYADYAIDKVVFRIIAKADNGDFTESEGPFTLILYAYITDGSRKQISLEALSITSDKEGAIYDLVAPGELPASFEMLDRKAGYGPEETRTVSLARFELSGKLDPDFEGKEKIVASCRLRVDGTEKTIVYRLKPVRISGNFRFLFL